MTVSDSSSHRRGVCRGCVSMTLGTPQQSAHRVFHRRGDVRPAAASAFATAATLVMTMMMVLSHRLVVIHHFLDSRRRGYGCHPVATRFHHIHRVHVRSNSAGFSCRMAAERWRRRPVSNRPERSLLSWNGTPAANRLHRSILCTGISIPKCDFTLKNVNFFREKKFLFYIRKDENVLFCERDCTLVDGLDFLHDFNIRIFLVLKIYVLYFRSKRIYFLLSKNTLFPFIFVKILTRNDVIFAVIFFGDDSVLLSS